MMQMFGTFIRIPMSRKNKITACGFTFWLPIFAISAHIIHVIDSIMIFFSIECAHVEFSFLNRF